jgi:flagellar biogenesis protein FliO
MKNLTYIFLISVLIIPCLYGQEENAINSPENISTGNTETPPQAQKIEAVPLTPSKEKIDKITSKPLFGSEKHRKSLNYSDNSTDKNNGLMLKTCLALAGVIGLILILFKLLKKVNSKYINTGENNPMRICNRTVLDTKNYLTLVRVYEEELLLSVGPHGTNLVARYALIDKEEGEFESMINTEGKKVISIDEDTHVSSINLPPIQDTKK